MSDGIDQIIAALRRRERESEAAITQGLADGARIVEGTAQTTAAYQGMSGATRASTVAYVATPTDSGRAEAQGAYTAAAGLLQGFTGHNGAPALTEVPGPGASEAWVVLTVPTDYAITLETDRAGEKAFIADSMHADAPQIQAAVAARLKRVWGG